MNNKIAIYLRLSLSDGDLKKGSKDESNSIENQRLLLHSYIEKQDDLPGEIVEYVDDGYTGTNFNRPAFQKMIIDLKQGEIKTIVVKDLSRLGRDYIGVGDYIEQIFPLMGVRFIAVNNAFDSMKLNNGTPGIEVAVSNLVNNLYSRDIGKKVRAALEVNWKSGKATSVNVPLRSQKVSRKILTLLFRLLQRAGGQFKSCPRYKNGIYSIGSCESGNAGEKIHNLAVCRC